MTTTKPTKYRNKPVEVKAIQVDGTNHLALYKFTGKKRLASKRTGMLVISGEHARHGDWLVKDSHGEIHVYTDTDFRHCFEPAQGD